MKQMLVEVQSWSENGGGEVDLVAEADVSDDCFCRLMRVLDI